MNTHIAAALAGLKFAVAANAYAAWPNIWAVILRSSASLGNIEVAGHYYEKPWASAISDLSNETEARTQHGSTFRPEMDDALFIALLNALTGKWNELYNPPR